MYLKDTWPEGSGLMGRLGRELNKVARLLNGATGYDGAQVFLTEQGLAVYGGGGGGGGTWTGVLWFGNTQTVLESPESPLTGWDEESETVPTPYNGTVTGEYLVVSLRDGTYRFEDADGTWDDSDEQVFHVADIVDETAEREKGYRLNNHTQGDIHARIT